MSNYVLDASALLALINEESGSEKVMQALVNGASIGAVNLAEVVTKLNEDGMPETAIHDALDPLRLQVIEFDKEIAYQTGLLRLVTRHAGLSLGDRVWEKVALTVPDITIQVIR